VMAMAAPTAKWSAASSTLVVRSVPKPAWGFSEYFDEIEPLWLSLTGWLNSLRIIQIQTISLDIGTEAVQFAKLIQLWWPEDSYTLR